MSANTVLVRGGRVLMRGARVLIGPAVRPVRMVIESLGYQDDDLRVDVGGRVVSDTRLNVTAYNGEVVSPTGAQGFNPAWQTAGFRKIVILDPGSVGELVQVWVTDVGGSCRTSPYMVLIDYSDGTSRTFQAGQSRNLVPPAWPAGTLSLVAGELSKAVNYRPFPAPGSPPIWVPNGEFAIPAASS